MPEEKKLYEQLLAHSYTKRDINKVIHQYLLHQATCKKAYKQLPLTGKVKWHYKNYTEQATGFLIHLTAKGLILLKTQFAKKPKNPV